MSNQFDLLIETLTQILKPLLINEGSKPGILYHFSKNLDGITDDLTSSNPVIKFSEQYYDDSPSESSDAPLFIVSTTRAYDLDFENEAYHDSKYDPYFYNIRFTLDGDKIAQRYKVSPYNYYSRFGTEQGTSPREYEERITTQKSGNSLPLKKYCLEVFLLLNRDADIESQDFKEVITSIVKYFSHLGIPVRTGLRYRPYK